MPPKTVARAAAGNLQNLLLGFLPPKELASLARHLERVSVAAGDTIAAPGKPYNHVFFPDSCVASLVRESDGGAKVEVGTVGREGMLGLPVFLGGVSGLSHAFFPIAGEGRQIPVARFLDLLSDSPVLDGLLRRYTLAYLSQVAQTALCNRLHSIEQRCARWLLMTDDRVGQGRTFVLTQLYLSWMLGAHRPGVSEAAAKLKRQGLIHYTRGRIAITDRSGLERESCSCYGIVRAEFAKLLDLPMAEYALTQV